MFVFLFEWLDTVKLAGSLNLASSLFFLIVGLFRFLAYMVFSSWWWSGDGMMGLLDFGELTPVFWSLVFVGEWPFSYSKYVSFQIFHLSALVRLVCWNMDQYWRILVASKVFVVLWMNEGLWCSADYYFSSIFWCFIAHKGGILIVTVFGILCASCYICTRNKSRRRQQCISSPVGYQEGLSCISD